MSIDSLALLCHFTLNIFRMEPASAENLLKAFHILDADGKGTLSKEYISKLMSEEGEPFTQARYTFILYI